MCNVPDYGVEEVSDHTVAMMLALAKKLPVLTRALREGDWDMEAPFPCPGSASPRWGWWVWKNSPAGGEEA